MHRVTVTATTMTLLRPAEPRRGRHRGHEAPNPGLVSPDELRVLVEPWLKPWFKPCETMLNHVKTPMVGCNMLQYVAIWQNLGWQLNKM